jgi:hypothetical protein
LGPKLALRLALAWKCFGAGEGTIDPRLSGPPAGGQAALGGTYGR